MKAHIAAECADEQGRFWEYHDILFENMHVWESVQASDMIGILSGFAIKVGVDVNSFRSCMALDDIRDEILRDIDDGVRYGVSGTPTFFVRNAGSGCEMVVGAHPYDTFKKIINQKLQQQRLSESIHCWRHHLHL